MQQRHHQVPADQRAGQPWPAGAGGAEQQRPLGGVQDKIAADQQQPLRISGDNGRSRFLGFLCPQGVVEAPVGQRRTTSATAWASARYLPRDLVAALRKSAQATSLVPTQPSQ